MAGHILTGWVLYRHPRDFPRHFVVRRQDVILGAAEVAPAPVGCLYDTIDAALRDWDGRGLAWLPRAPGDEPQILGVWI